METDPALLAKIEAESGVRMADQDPKMLAFIVERSKKAGNEAFGRKDYQEAVRMYCQAIAGDNTDKTLFANRSAAYLNLQRYDEAVLDASKAVTLDPQWPKGFYRLGCALLMQQNWPDAVQALAAGLQLSPDSKDFQEKLKLATEHNEEYLEQRRIEKSMQRREIVQQLREARRHDNRELVLNSWRQSMSGPDFEAEDYEWRPTFLPGMRQFPIDKSVFESDRRKAMAMSYVTSLSELDQPKKMLSLFTDEARLQAYDAAVTRAVAKANEVTGGHAHTLVVEAGGGFLPLMAGRAGASTVTALERSRMLYRMAKQNVEINRAAAGGDAVKLVDRDITACWVQGEPVPPAVLASAAAIGEKEGAGAGEAGGEGSLLEAPLASRADCLVIDTFDHAALGMHALRNVDYAAAHLLKPGATVVPARMELRAQLIEFRIKMVSGLDLSPLNMYRWHPQAERVDLKNEPNTLRFLSKPFKVCNIDLQARVDAAGATDEAGALWEMDETLQIMVTEGGMWNGVAFWFELALDGDTTLSSYAEPGREDLPAGTSWQQAVQYLDELPLKAGATIPLRVKRDKSQIIFQSTPPSTKPRHAWVPRWHYDMLSDQSRNDAYERAVTKAIRQKKEAGAKEVMVIDVGAGSGLLSMLAARNGADKVVGIEHSLHMCEVGEECQVMNGFLPKCMMLNRDSRRVMSVDSDGAKNGRKPDGNPCELDRKADILIYEVFDSGLIGEGCLHLATLAKMRLCHPNAILLPMGATVYAQPIQMRVSDVAGFDFQQVNRYRWRAEYEGVELGLAQNRHLWEPLADPVEIFVFDFYDVEQNSQAFERQVDFPVTTDGIFNAIAFWFELQVDDDPENELSTSPYDGTKGQTWQQAVQYVEEMHVKAGETLPLMAKHDTYGISFTVQDSLVDRVTARTGVPLFDPVWHATYQRIESVNSDIMRATVQNPLEYRNLAETAVAFGARPADLGMEAVAASDFCLRIVS